ncbi:MAG: glucosyl-3-phosphoglycerate synthase [Candidatus Binatia bacterium]
MDLAEKILIPLIDPPQAVPYLRLAAALLPPEGKIVAVKVVRVPEESSLSEGAEKAPTDRAALEELKAQFPDERVQLKTLVRVSHRLSVGIDETVREEGCDLLLLPWKGYSASEERLFGATIDQLLEQPPCRTLVVRDVDPLVCKRILLAGRGGPYAEFALEIASRLALSQNAEVTVLHSERQFPAHGLRDQPYLTFLHKLPFHPAVKRLVTVQGDPETAIIEEAKRHDIVIVGAAGRTEPQAFFLGPIVDHIARGMQKPLIVVKTPHPLKPWLDTDLPGKPRPLSEKVDKWFAENSFHAKEFADLKKLVDLKEKQGITISLGLPALNEGETIGKIIQTIKKGLLDEVPLLDEIVLIDSGSTDDTARIAQDLGIPVCVHQEILLQYGSYRGKGEALWKSLYMLKGDLVVWIDTDIKNIHPSFVYGLLGPMLNEPQIHYVKGFYRRPIRVGENFYASGGGRVTELTARPFLNLFFPELSGIVQPLAGEHGGRREVLEHVPFFTGYGVETGLLIDIYSAHDLHSIAQVDLEERIHRNQALPALSQMSFAIIQVFLKRLEERKKIELLEELNQSMKLVKRKRRAYALEVRDIQDYERPPMITIPEYQARTRKFSFAESEAFH